MATVIVSTNIAGNVKPSFASSPIVGLTVRANGEERVSVLDMNGLMFDANIPVPTTAPTLTRNADSGHLDANKWYGYAYVYAATSHYPFVENDITVGGSVAPRGNPSPVATLQSDGGGCSIHLAGFVVSGRSDVDFIWIFRTSGFASSQEALDNGNAGNLYYIGSVANSGTPTYNDLNPVDGTDQVEVDNFATPPQFQFVAYADPYWWGWGNYPLSAAVSWATSGVITLTDGSKWFNGRDGQYVRLSGFSTGGIGNNGLWLFKWLTATTMQLKLADGTTNATLASNGSGTIVVQGNPTTLYRSKPRNPFSWGSTEILADGDRVPTQYAFKVGGGLGTAIGVVPTVPYLLLCTEYPANVFTLDLRQAGTTSFENSLRNISTFYSITSHFSQFVAKKVYSLTREEREERQVLWGWDAKNYCILECDGTSIHPVSQKVSKTLRRASKTRSKQILAHGAYDAKNGLNCLWIPTDETDMQVNLLICQHAYTGQWFIRDEHDLLCSAQFQDGDTNLSKIYCGTEGGFVGEAFAEGFYYDWISSGRSFGTYTTFTASSITRDDGILFYLDRDGYVGNWVLLMDVNGEHEQWARISAVTASTLTFDYIIDSTGAHGLVSNGKLFSPSLAAGGIFMVGVIECRVLKMFSFGAAAEDKKLSEVWLTLAGVDIAKTPNQPGSTILRFYRRRDDVPFAPRSTTGLLNVWLKQVHFDDSVLTQTWFTQEPATERMKQIGIEIIDRGFVQWRFYDWTLKISQ